MVGTITEFFGFRSTDKSAPAKKTAALQECPFIHEPCNKTLSRDSGKTYSGACAVKQKTSNESVICCPIRLYADDYKLLHIIAEKTFKQKLPLFSGRQAVEGAKRHGGAVAVFGHKWGGELRLPKRNGTGNYFADWVLAFLDKDGKLQEFTSIEVQTIDTTGNYRLSRMALAEPERRIVSSSLGLNWENVNKRIIPQLVYKGQVLQREKLCKSGLWFVTPEPVYQKILSRLGGEQNLTFGYSPQPGALHFLRYDYDISSSVTDGHPTPLTVVGDECTTVEKVQAAFNNVALPEPGVYGTALKHALFD